MILIRINPLKIINLLLQIDRDLNAKPCKETLVKAIPFLSDLHFLATNTTNQSSSGGGGGGGGGGMLMSASSTGPVPITSSSSRSNLAASLSNANIVNSWSGGGPANLSQIVRNPSNAFLTNGANNPNGNNSSSPSARQIELLYTGL